MIGSCEYIPVRVVFFARSLFPPNRIISLALRHCRVREGLCLISGPGPTAAALQALPQQLTGTVGDLLRRCRMQWLVSVKGHMIP